MAPTVRNPNKAIAWVPVFMMGLPAMVMAENVTNWASWVVPDSFPYKGLTSTITYAPGTTGNVVDPVTGERVDLILSGEVWRVREDFSWYVLGFDDAGKVTFTPDYNGIPVYTSEVSPTAIFGSDQVAATGDTLDEYMAHTLTFSQDVTNAVMPIYSLGALPTEARLTFSQPFVVLSSDGRFTSGGDSTSGYTLSGNEGNGLIQFLGTYDTISWVIEDVEISHGISIGLTTPPNPLAGTVVPVYDLFGEGTGVTAPTTFAVFEPEPEPEPEPDPNAEPDPEPEPEPEPASFSLLDALLADASAITISLSNIAQNIGAIDGSIGLSTERDLLGMASIIGDLSGADTVLSGTLSQVSSSIYAQDLSTSTLAVLAPMTLEFGNLTTTAIGVLQSGAITATFNSSGVVQSVSANTARVGALAETYGGMADTIAIQNVSANAGMINGSATLLLVDVNAKVDGITTTAIGTLQSGVMNVDIVSRLGGVTETTTTLISALVGSSDDF